jgi:hypothetical protein
MIAPKSCGDVARVGRRLAAVLLVLGLVWIAPSSAVACPACKEALASQGPGAASGFATSIAIMLLVPAVILLAWGVALWRYTSWRGARRDGQLVSQSVTRSAT